MTGETFAESKHVLVVDVDPTHRQALAGVLERAGFSVTVCPPEAAAERVIQGPFAALVLGRVPDPGDLAKDLRRADPDARMIFFGARPEQLSPAGFEAVPSASLDDGWLEQAVRAAAEASTLSRQNRTLSLALDRSNRLLRALDLIAAERSGPPDLDRLLQAVVAGAKDLAGAEAARAMVFTQIHDEKELLVEAAAGDDADALVGARFGADQGIAAKVVFEQASFLLDQGSDHPAYSRRLDELRAEGPGYICVPLHHGTVHGSLAVAGRARPFEEADLAALKALASQAAVSADDVLAEARAFNFFTNTADLLVSLLDRLDVFYPAHSRATAALADMVTRRLGLPVEERRLIHFAALLHDVGKLRLDPLILSSEGRWKEVRPEVERHPELAVQMLKPIAAWHDLLPIILSHHERWDGQGYPHGLKGEEIPLGARVIAVTESFDAMIHRTGHGVRRSRDEAFRELEHNAGRQFDPRIVRLFETEYRLHQDQVEV